MGKVVGFFLSPGSTLALFSCALVVITDKGEKKDTQGGIVGLGSRGKVSEHEHEHEGAN